MTDQRISYETAKLAKEKGFVIPDNMEHLTSFFRDTPTPSKWRFKAYSIWENSPKYYAPTQSLLHKWLREEKNFFIRIVRLPISITTAWSFKIEPHHKDWDEVKSVMISRNKDLFKGESIYYTSYEKALEVGLLNTLKLIN